MGSRFILFIILFFPSLTWSGGVTLRPVSTGAFRANYADLVEGGKREKVWLPIPVYIIHHPEGIVLFDSGLGTRFDREVKGWWLNRLLQLPLPYVLRDQDTAVERLKKIGIPAGAVKVVIVSHLHLDHAGGLKDFPKAQVIVSRAEWENAGVDRWRARVRGVMKEQMEGITPGIIDYQPGTAVGPFEASYDLYGDGTLILLQTPGHTPGHQSLLVTLGSGKKVLLTGDAVWVEENFERPAPKGWKARLLEEADDEAWMTTLRIRQFHEENPEVLIIPGHDPHLWPKLPAFLE